MSCYARDCTTLKSGHSSLQMVNTISFDTSVALAQFHRHQIQARMARRPRILRYKSYCTALPNVCHSAPISSTTTSPKPIQHTRFRHSFNNTKCISRYSFAYALADNVLTNVQGPPSSLCVQHHCSLRCGHHSRRVWGP